MRADMKKSCALFAILALLTTGASAAPRAGAPATPSVSLDTQRYSEHDSASYLGADAVYTIAGEREHPDIYGCRMSYNLYDNDHDRVRHMFNVNLTMQKGTETCTKAGGFSNWHVPGYTPPYDIELTILPITAGYDLNLAITDKTMFFCGVKAGLAIAKVEISGHGQEHKDNSIGITYAFGAGLRYQCNEFLMLRLGYELSQMYLDHIAGNNYLGHSFLLGAGCSF